MSATNELGCCRIEVAIDLARQGGAALDPPTVRTQPVDTRAPVSECRHARGSVPADAPPLRQCCPLTCRSHEGWLGAPGSSSRRPALGKGRAMTRRFKQFGRMGAGVGVASLVFAALAVSTPQAAAQDWSRCLEGSSDTQAVFARAAQASGVPQDVLLAVGYLSSRWSNNDGAPSTSGGYGVMHLTDFAAGRNGGAAKGDTDRGPGRAGTLRLAADLTSFTPAQLRADHVANICGGAAVLASYQPGTTSQQPADWTEAVARYAGTAEEGQDRAVHRPGLRRAAQRRHGDHGPRRHRHAGGASRCPARPRRAGGGGRARAGHRRAGVPRHDRVRGHRGALRADRHPDRTPGPTSTTTSPTARTT